MMISVAMTTYNGEKYIVKQLESLMNQTRKADEIIIVDDVSKDNTVALVEQFIDVHQLSHWHLYVNEQNLGYKKNFYKSISLTHGDLVFLCDQDDLWEPEKLELIETVFEENPTVLAVNTTFTIVDAKDQPQRYQCRRGSYNNDLIRGHCAPGKLQKINYDIIMKYNISPGCTMAFRECIKDIYLKNSLSRLPHDWELNIIAAGYDGLYFLNQPLIRYRIHDKNTLGMNTDDSISDFEFQGDLDFRKKALEDRKLFRLAMDEWHEKLRSNKKQLKIYGQILNYDQLRMDCVYDKKLSSWIKLVVHTLLLWDGKHIRFKTLFGDLYYIVKH